jgi:3-dehydroquinate synthase
MAFCERCKDKHRKWFRKSKNSLYFVAPKHRSNMESISTTEYQIHFDDEAYPALNSHLVKAGYSKVFVLVDENTRRDCLQVFLEGMQDLPDYELLQIRAGEEHKCITTCSQLWKELSEKGADRKSVLINLGGGVLTDLGGFVASTFKRGIAFINVPTSLLAMVDASIGGKTGVDLGTLKNQIGVINQPEMVLIITEFLKTLEPRQLKSGFAEMLKHGLIRNKAYWTTLKGLNPPEQIGAFIYESVRIKNEVVLQDPREDNLRKILNFGHTLGHAIESYYLQAPDRESLLHGEAIAIGMILEAYLSHKVCGLSGQAMVEIRETFMHHFPRVNITASETKEILELLVYDKKNTHGQINYVLLNSIGNPVIDQAVPPEIVRQAFTYYMD